jgi:hypothetical protein
VYRKPKFARSAPVDRIAKQIHLTDEQLNAPRPRFSGDEPHQRFSCPKAAS